MVCVSGCSRKTCWCTLSTLVNILLSLTMQLKSPLNCFRHPMSLTSASSTTMSSGSSHYSLPLSSSLISDCGWIMIAFWCLMWIHCATLLLVVGIWCGLVCLCLVLWNSMFLLSSLIFFLKAFVHYFFICGSLQDSYSWNRTFKMQKAQLSENGCLLFKFTSAHKQKVKGILPHVPREIVQWCCMCVNC